MGFWFCVGMLKLFVLKDIFSSYLNTSLVSMNTLNYETLWQYCDFQSQAFSGDFKGFTFAINKHHIYLCFKEKKLFNLH